MMYAPGVMARSIADIRLWLSIVEGMNGRSPRIPPAPVEAVGDCLEPYPRIAWTDRFGNIPVTTDTRTTLESVAQYLTEQNCHVEQAGPKDFDYEYAWEIYGTLAAAWLASRPIPILPTLWDTLRKVLAGGAVIRGALRGNRLSAKKLADVLAEGDRLTRQLDEFLSQWDAWICPVMPLPAFPHHPVAKPFTIEGQTVSYLLGGVAFTSIFTLTGHPVVVVPVGQSASGLPIGVQVIGRRWHDQALLTLIEQILEPFIYSALQAR